MGWRARFEAVIEELQSHPDIEVWEAELQPPATDEDIAAASEAFGHALPDDVEAFYREMNGAKIKWGHTNQAWAGHGATGSIYLFGVRTTFRKEWATDGYGNKPFHPFDWPVDEYYAGHDPMDPGVLRWVYDTANEARVMKKTSFTQYLDAALESRGWCYWQEMYLYDADVASQLGATRQQMEGEMQAVLPLLFPNFDVSKIGAAKDCAPSDVSHLDEGEVLVVYRLDDLPPELTQALPPDAGPRKCLFWAARDGCETTSELFAAIPEPDVDHVSEGMAVAAAVGEMLTQSHKFAELVRPDQVPRGGRVSGGAFSAGFHTGDGDEVESWLRDKCRIVPAKTLLDDLLLLSVKDTHGGAVQVLKYSSHTVNAGMRRDMKELGGRGLFVLDRDDAAFEKFDLIIEGDDEKKVTLVLADLPASGYVTVTVE